MASAGLRDDDGCIHATSRKALKTRRLQKQASSMHAIPSRRSNGVVLSQPGQVVDKLASVRDEGSQGSGRRGGHRILFGRWNRSHANPAPLQAKAARVVKSSHTLVPGGCPRTHDWNMTKTFH